MKDEADQIAPSPGTPSQETPDSRRSGEENLDQHSNAPVAPLNPAPTTNVSNASRGEDLDAQLDGPFTWPDDCFFDTTIDWFAWTNQEIT